MTTEMTLKEMKTRREELKQIMLECNARLAALGVPYCKECNSHHTLEQKHRMTLEEFKIRINKLFDAQ